MFGILICGDAEFKNIMLQMKDRLEEDGKKAVAVPEEGLSERRIRRYVFANMGMFEGYIGVFRKDRDTAPVTREAAIACGTPVLDWDPDDADRPMAELTAWVQDIMKKE